MADSGARRSLAAQLLNEALLSSSPNDKVSEALGHCPLHQLSSIPADGHLEAMFLPPAL